MACAQSCTRDRLQGVIGQVVMALSVVPRYRHPTLADLQHLEMEPLMRDRIAIASAHARAAGGCGAASRSWREECTTRNLTMAGGFSA